MIFLSQKYCRFYNCDKTTVRGTSTYKICELNFNEDSATLFI